jgi:hypothetical protein
MLLDTTETAAADFAQNGILAREITEKRGLADFEDPHDVLDPSILVTVLPEQANRRVNDLLTQPRFFALSEAQGFFAVCSSDSGKASPLP